MNIFDPLITGSLSVSGSGEISGDLTVLGTINATISGTTSNAISASHAAEYLLTSSFEQFTGSYTTGSFTGSFIGDGSELYNIPASGVTGLNLSRISEGSATASISETDGFVVNTNAEFSGSLTVTGSILLNGESLDDRLDSLETESSSIRTDFNTYTSSNDSTNTTQNSRLDSLETSTGSLNTFTSSIDVTIKNKLNADGVISGSIQVDISETTGYSTFSSSIRDTTTNIENRVSFLEIESGSIRTDFNTYTGSNDSTNTTQNNRLDAIETSTGSLNSFTSSIDTTIKNKLNADGVISGSIQIEITETTGYSTFSSSIATTNLNQNSRLDSIEISTSSLNGFTSSTNIKLNLLDVATGSIRTDFNNYTSSNDSTNNTQDARLSVIEISTGSLNSFTSSINTTIKNKLNVDGVISGSIQVNIVDTTGYNTFSSSVSSSIGSLSGSIATTTNNLSVSMSSLSASFSTTDTNHENRLDTIESHYATTGSNIFIGNQTITGSLYISQNLIVQGESSVENITASAVSIGTNTIILNTDSPAVRYAGISVFDSGSTNVTASLFYDSLTNNWKFEHNDVGTNDASILIFGPLGTGIDNAPILDANYLTKVENDGHGHHITTSSIFDNGSIISLKNNTEITGALVVTGTIKSNTTTLISGSSQVSFNGISDKPTLISGSSQVDHNATTNYNANQHIDHTSVSISAGNGLTGGGTIAANRTISLDTSSSTFTDGVKTKLNADGVISGSSQVSFNGISDKPTLVSGSGQISFNGITDKPTLVSGSSQIDHDATTNFVANEHIDHTSVSISAGNGLTGGGTIASTRTLTLDTGSAHFVNGARKTISISDTGGADGINFSYNEGTGVLSGTLQNSSITIAGTATSLGGSISAATILSGTGVVSGSAQLTSSFVQKSGDTMTGPLRFNDGGYGRIAFTDNFHGLILRGIPNNAAGDVTFGDYTTLVQHSGDFRFYRTNGSINELYFQVNATAPYWRGNVILHANNYNSYSPTLTGTGASGTWGISISGNAATANSAIEVVRTISAGNSANLVYATIADNDYFRIHAGGSSNSGYVEIATSDDGTEPIYVRQYTGVFSSLTRTLTLLDGSGNTSFPGQVTFQPTANGGDHGIKVGAIRGSSFGSQTGDYIMMYERVHIGYPSGWGATLADAPSYGLGVWGNIHVSKSNVTGGGIILADDGDIVDLNDAYCSMRFSSGVRIYSANKGGSAVITLGSDGNILPGSNGVYNLGSSSLRWNTVFTSDLSMSNGIGDYTIVEGEEDLFIYNNKTNKVFKFLLQEVDPSIVPPKKI